MLTECQFDGLGHRFGLASCELTSMIKQIFQSAENRHINHAIEELFLLCAVGVVLFWLGWMFGQRSNVPVVSHSSAIQVEHEETFGRFGRRTATQPF